MPEKDSAVIPYFSQPFDAAGGHQDDLLAWVGHRLNERQRGKAPRAIFVSGPCGTGKSTFLRNLAAASGTAIEPGGAPPGGTVEPDAADGRLRIDGVVPFVVRLDGATLAEKCHQALSARRFVDDLAATWQRLVVLVDDLDVWVEGELQMDAAVHFLAQFGRAFKDKGVVIATSTTPVEEIEVPHQGVFVETFFPADCRARLSAKTILLPAIWIFNHRTGRVLPDGPLPSLLGGLDRLVGLTSTLKRRAGRANEATPVALTLFAELVTMAEIQNTDEEGLFAIDQIGKILRPHLGTDVQAALEMTKAMADSRPETNHRPTAEDQATGAAGRGVTEGGPKQTSDATMPWLERLLLATAVLELVEPNALLSVTRIATAVQANPSFQGTTAGQLERTSPSARETASTNLNLAVTNGVQTLLKNHVLVELPRVGLRVETAAGRAWALERAELEVWPQDRNDAIELRLHELVQPLDGKTVGFPKRPVAVVWADGRRAHDVTLSGTRAVRSWILDVRFMEPHRRGEEEWRRRSEELLAERLVWVAEGDRSVGDQLAWDLARSRRMVERHGLRSRPGAKESPLVTREQARATETEAALLAALEADFVAGAFYRRGERWPAAMFGERFDLIALAAMDRAFTAPE